MKLAPPILLALALALIPATVHADDEEIEFWDNHKISPEQPFPAKVEAVTASWVGYSLLLKEMDGERLCIAQFMNGQRAYFLIDDKVEIARFSQRGIDGWIFVEPAIEVERFSWSMGPWKIGAIFGKEDIAQKSKPNPKGHPFPFGGTQNPK